MSHFTRKTTVSNLTFVLFDKKAMNRKRKKQYVVNPVSTFTEKFYLRFTCAKYDFEVCNPIGNLLLTNIDGNVWNKTVIVMRRKFSLTDNI